MLEKNIKEITLNSDNRDRL